MTSRPTARPSARLLTLVPALCLLLVAGCASTREPANVLYDFGAAVPAPGAPALSGTLVVTDVTGAVALDSERMFYRLNYADPLQARSYAGSRWSTTPLQMLTARVKTRLAQAGAKVLGVTDAANGVPILRMDVDNFVQAFDSAGASHAELTVRASLFRGHALVDQKTFTRRANAGSADAAGGARALAEVSDAASADMVAWLATLAPRLQ